MSKNIFTAVQMPGVKYNRFDLSHDVKMSFKMGFLVPTTCMEVLPGDKFSINVENMLRLAPLVSPVMHKINVTTHFFYVPNRIIWDDWEDFITGGTAEVPTFNLTSSVNERSLACYLGYPLVADGNYQPAVSALPIAAYNKIFNEYYRDENLVQTREDSCVNGDNPLLSSFATAVPAKRAWSHDYFTSALPFAQKGDAVALPLGTFQDVDTFLDNTSVLQTIRKGDGTPITGDQNPLRPGLAFGELQQGSPATAINAWLDPLGSIKARTSDLEAMAADITDVRRAFKLQEFLEREARGGTRYTEILKSAFNVNSSDARLQRPEYIGGAYQNMVISEVLSTAQTDTDDGSGGTVQTPVGNLAGHGISVGRGKHFHYRAEEHGWIIGIINVQPRTAYYQGLHRSFTRTDRLDYYWKEFATIGEQEILNKELVADSTDPDGIFGYIPRYSEYRFMNSRIAGEFQTSLNFWQMARQFPTGVPTVLNENFISSTPTTQIFASTADSDHIYSHVFNNVSCIRALPKFGNPKL